jgi:hypothetical protein
MKNIISTFFFSLVFALPTLAMPLAEFSADAPEAIAPKVNAPMGRIEFQWGAVTGATSYELELLSDDHTIVYLGAADLTTTSFSFPANGQLQLSVPYDWHVRAAFPDGHQSDWSPAERFYLYDPANPPAPTPAPVVQPLAAGYEVVISQGQNVITQANVGNDTKLILNKALKINTDYTWKVRAKFNDQTKSTWSDSLAFRLTAAKWNGEITYLRARSLGPLDVELKWTPLAADAGASYRVFVRSYDGPATTVFVTNGTTANSAVLGASEGLKRHSFYSWIVMAYDSTGARVGQSAKGGFVTH